ncbi:hypothetical protein ACFWUW_14160 [Streptomyces sp. NPDC058655]|uniref:hypothetical protein n=1 Tax=Streptomyces sp. NPDC058655 TaxID=3346577 RepID=UPI00364CA643
MRRTKWAALAGAVIALAAAGCGTGGGEAGTEEAAASVPVSPRPAGAGPLTREVVRTDLDTSAAAAGVPATEPGAAGVPERAPAGSALSCVVAFKGFGSEAAPVDAARFGALTGELRKRGWQQTQKQTERKGVSDGAVHEARAVLTQRGWSMVAEYRTARESGVITLFAFDDACRERNGADAGPVG